MDNSGIKPIWRKCVSRYYFKGTRSNKIWRIYNRYSSVGSV